MALLAAMSEKRKLPRVSSRVPFAFKDRVDEMKLALQRRRRWFYNGEKLSEEGIVAAVLLEFLAMGQAEREALLDRRLPEMERIFEAERGEGPEAGPDVTAPEIVPGPARRRKGAI